MVTTDAQRQVTLRYKNNKPIATYGHFGRENGDFPWEKTDKSKLLRSALKKDIHHMISEALKSQVAASRSYSWQNRTCLS